MRKSPQIRPATVAKAVAVVAAAAAAPAAMAITQWNYLSNT